MSKSYPDQDGTIEEKEDMARGVLDTGKSSHKSSEERDYMRITSS